MVRCLAGVLSCVTQIQTDAVLHEMTLAHRSARATASDSILTEEVTQQFLLYSADITNAYMVRQGGVIPGHSHHQSLGSPSHSGRPT